MERSRTETIREFILDLAATETAGLARQVAEAYGISRQAANRHLDILVEGGLLEQSGKTRARVYRLRRMSSITRELRVTPVLNPDRVWDDHLAPIVHEDRPAVRDLCRAVFGELVRNASAHADASWITFTFSNTARDIALSIADDGRGLFSSIAPRLAARSPRETATMIARLAHNRSVDSPAARLALLARNFELFSIRANGAVLSFDRETDAWTVDDEVPTPGTTVAVTLRRTTATRDAAETRKQRLTASAG